MGRYTKLHIVIYSLCLWNVTRRKFDFNNFPEICILFVSMWDEIKIESATIKLNFLNKFNIEANYLISE